MDFFEHQERARQKTHLLVFYFLLAVIGIIVAIYFLSLAASAFFQGNHSLGGIPRTLWRPGLFLAVSAGTGATIFLASTFKTMQLSGGGKVIAMELGGRKVDTNTSDLHERRLLNIVEEMAIAAGLPVPDVYVMDKEQSINAFAAGRSHSDAVISVTRGCMKLLSRDELQGVVAHEFSHILNGDMKLNMRLIGLLFGILFLALVGEIIMRGVLRGGQFARSNRKGSGGGVLAILAIGLGLMLVGYIGLFFANLIKASISRQREFLADASAVQFTRNPDGLAGALKKLGAPGGGSIITHPMATDASHLFFGNALKRNLFATHPPLAERIKRLVPQWDGKFPPVKLPPINGEKESGNHHQIKGAHRPVYSAGMFLEGEQDSVHMTGSEALESMGSVHPEQIEFGRQMLAHLPDQWIKLCRHEPGAQAIVFALLLSQDDALKNAELSQLRQSTDERTFQISVSLQKDIARIHSAVKLGLLDLCIPTLRRLSPTEYERFHQITTDLIECDRQVNLFEFTLQKIVSRHLDTYFHQLPLPQIRYRKIDKLLHETAVLISTLAALGNSADHEAIQEAFRTGAAHIEEITHTSVPFLSEDQCGLDQIGNSLDRFAQATPTVKKQLIVACSLCLMTDHAMTSHEAELVRAIADTIGCAIPPFVRTAVLV